MRNSRIFFDFVNEVYTVEEVEKFCKENGVTLVKKEKESSTDKDGAIIYQSRKAGTKVVSGTTLTITVSKAPTVTPEPDNTTNNSTNTNTDNSTGTNSNSNNTTTDNKTTTSSNTSSNTTNKTE